MHRAKRDFIAYVHWSDQPECFDPSGLSNMPIPKGDRPTIEGFRIWESAGKIVPVLQPQLLRAAIRGKALLNLQIKMWASMIADRLHIAGYAYVAAMELLELRRDFPWLPQWLWEALWKQAWSLSQKTGR